MGTIFFTMFSFLSVHFSLEGSIIPLASEVPMRAPRLCTAAHVAMGLRDINFSYINLF